MIGNQSICLCFIYKDESKVLGRMLTSALPIIDAVACVDTGSTDDSTQIILDFCHSKNIPLKHTQQTFQDFSTARNTSYKLACGTPCDWVLFIDCDEVLFFMSAEDLPQCDSISLEHTTAGVNFWRPTMVRNRANIHFMGRCHEMIVGLTNTKKYYGMKLPHIADGNDSTSRGERNISLLLEDVYENDKDTRSVFYLAQELRGQGKYLEASERYLQRILLGGWEEERWYAQFQYGRCLLNDGDLKGVHELYRAYSENPTRVEPLYYLAQHFISSNMYPAAYVAAQVGITIPIVDGLFVEKPVYDVWMLWTFIEIALEVGRSEEASEAAHIILDNMAMGAHVPQDIFITCQQLTSKIK